MNAVERLKRDHAVLRSKLDVLESALTMGPETWYVLREVCFTLSRQLQDHIRREEELVTACRAAMNPNVLAEVVVEHRDEPRHLRAINRLFVSAGSHSLARITPVLRETIQQLRRHMAEEETELFPIFERVLGAQNPGATPPVVQPPRLLDEAMTVNRVVQQFPRTRSVFERLFINVPFEGCTCLDEAAWRHGIEVRDLIRVLEGVIASCRCGEEAPTAPAEPRFRETVGIRGNG